MSEWIKVSERLPEKWTEVMVWPHPSDQNMTAELRHDGEWEYQEYVHHHGWDSVKIKAPTHWMPLPAPPKGTP